MYRHEENFDFVRLSVRAWNRADIEDYFIGEGVLKMAVSIAMAGDIVGIWSIGASANKTFSLHTLGVGCLYGRLKWSKR